MTRVRQLFDLQELDGAITLHRSEIQKLESSLKETEELLAARDDLVATQKTLEEVQKSHRELDTEVADLRVKLDTANRKLTGGSIKNPREVVALKADHDQQKAVVTKKEDRLLELMEEIEQRQSEIGRKQAEVDKIQKSWEDSQARARRQLEQERSILAELDQRRQATVEKLDPTSIKLYDSLRAKKGKAMARLERGMCMACRVTLPMNLVQRARSNSTEAVFCCNCERILVVG